VHFCKAILVSLIETQVGLHSLAPQPTDSIFDDWWERVGMNTSGLIKKGLDSHNFGGLDNLESSITI
jgi:hypothetical protein